MACPADRKYLPTHEWHKVEGNVVTIGISRFATEELTDITYLEVIREIGPIEAGAHFGEIESVKATSELYCGIDGMITQINEAVIDNPALINEDPYEKGWIIRVEAADLGQLDALLSSEEYDKEHGE